MRPTGHGKVRTDRPPADRAGIPVEVSLSLPEPANGVLVMSAIREGTRRAGAGNARVTNFTCIANGPTSSRLGIQPPAGVVLRNGKPPPGMGAGWLHARYYVSMGQHITTFAFANIPVPGPIWRQDGPGYVSG